MQFSVIITAFNIKEYVEEAINSVMDQTLKDFECIIVDDGSFDGTTETIKRVISDDKRFRLICKEHTGVSEAKDIGLNNAHGDYVTFIDGDDTIRRDCLETFKKELKEDDMIICGINYQTYENGRLIMEKAVAPADVVFDSGCDLADWYVKNHSILLYSNANKIYRRSLIVDNHLCFEKGCVFGEDRKFNYDFLRVCGKIKTSVEPLYNYRSINPHSLTSEFTQHYIDTALKLHEMKMEHLIPLAKKSTEAEIAAYRHYDVCKETLNALCIIAEYRDILTKEQYIEEMNYLRGREFPEYFYHYTNSCNLINSENDLIKYINRAVFPSGNDMQDIKEIRNVVILGSFECEYRAEAAWNKFSDMKDIRYLCSGGNPSSYLDYQGNAMKECDFLKQYLIERGISKDNVISDCDADNTYDNLRNAFIIHDLEPGNSVIVTGAFHVRRTKSLLQKLKMNVEIIPVYGPHTRPDNWFMSVTGIEAVMGEYMKL